LSPDHKNISGLNMKKWDIQERRELFNRRIFSIDDLRCYHPEKDVTHDFYVLNNPDWINIVVLTHDESLVLVKQHRLGTDEITIETVAGLMNDEELPEISAQRELLEETGFQAGEMILMKKLSANPAIMSNHIYFYLALNSRKIADQSLDMAEDIDVITVSQHEALEMISEGTINHTIIVTALSLFFLSPYSHIPSEKLRELYSCSHSS